MVKTINLFTVKDKGWAFATKLRSIKDVQLIIAHLLVGRGYEPNEAGLLSSDTCVWFKPNKHEILICVTETSQKVSIPQQEESVNILLTKLKLFNGKGLKYNSPESCKAKYKSGQFTSHDVKMAESVFWGKGQSVIFKQTKKEKSSTMTDGESANKVANLTPQGWFDDTMSVSTIIKRRLQISSPTDVYRDLKGKYNMGSNELNRLIYKISHG